MKKADDTKKPKLAIAACMQIKWIEPKCQIKISDDCQLSVFKKFLYLLYKISLAQSNNQLFGIFAADRGVQFIRHFFSLLPTSRTNCAMFFDRIGVFFFIVQLLIDHRTQE